MKIPCGIVGKAAANEIISILKANNTVLLKGSMPADLI